MKPSVGKPLRCKVAKALVFILPIGRLPAEQACKRPAPKWFIRASPKTLRQELPVHNTRTFNIGMPFIFDEANILA
jgi:hypothetical protein